MKSIVRTGFAVLVALGVVAGHALALGTGTVNRTSGWYPAGTNLTVTATPSAGDRLSGWSGDTNNATFGESTITFLVNAPKTITATFADILHTITSSVVGNGTIDPLGEVSVAQGDSRTFSISPDANHYISGLKVDDVSVTVTNSYTFASVSEPHTIEATFAINAYEVTFLAGAHGSLSGAATSQTIDHGSDATPPTITADAGYTSAGWDDSYVNVTSARTLTALYTTNEYTITFDSDGGSAVDSITQLYGTTITPPSNPTKVGYTFLSWSPSLPATMPLNGGSYTAQWSANAMQLIIISEHGTPTPSGTNNHDYGATVEFAMAGSPDIIPSNTMYEVTGWSRTGSAPSTGTSTNDSFVITNNTTITWQWSTNYWIDINTDFE